MKVKLLEGPLKGSIAFVDMEFKDCLYVHIDTPIESFRVMKYDVELIYEESNL